MLTKYMFNQKKKYFKRKAKAIQKQIWDSEFKREKTLMIREEIRIEYDGVQSRLSIIEEQIKTFPEYKTTWTDEQKHFYDEKIRLDSDKTRFENQMKQLDIDVHGSKKTNEYPDGVDGIEQTLDVLRELLEMVKEYIKKI